MIGTFAKQIVGNELYLYNAKGELIFKRWIDQGRSLVFTPWAYGKDTLVSITDNTIKSNIK
jgi:hypothetical protein